MNQNVKDSGDNRSKAGKWGRIQLKVPKVRKDNPFMVKFNAQIHPDLPKPPMLVCLCGKRNSGKSVTLANLLDTKTDGMWGKAFTKDNIILVSETYRWDLTLHGLKLPPENVLTDMSTLESDLKAIFEKQAELVEDDNDRPVLLVFEDITQCLAALNWIMSMGYKGRHLNVQIAYVAHKMSSIPRGARTQTPQWLVFNPVEGSERRWFFEMFADPKSRHIWEAACDRAWSIPYNFVYINREAPMENMYRSGFHDPLFTPEEFAQLFNPKFFNDQPKEERKGSVLQETPEDIPLSKHSS